MNSKRVFVAGDSQQRLYRFRNSIVHGGNPSLHVQYYEKDGRIFLVGYNHDWMSAEHVIPRELLIRRLSDHLRKPDDAQGLIMPEIGQRLLPFILPKRLREAVAGDLAEDFTAYAIKWGRPYALRWLWWELGGLCIRRFGPTAIITAVAMWCRQKLGW
jgi:hypothetical protein